VFITTNDNKVRVIYIPYGRPWQVASETQILPPQALKPLNFKELGLASEKPLFPVEIIPFYIENNSYTIRTIKTTNIKFSIKLPTLINPLTLLLLKG